MATDFRGYYLNEYVADTWTDAVEPSIAETFAVRHMMICNTTGTNIDVSLRIVDSEGTVEKAIIINAYALQSTQPISCRGIFIILADGDKIQFKATNTGVHFAAWGGAEV